MSPSTRAGRLITAIAGELLDREKILRPLPMRVQLNPDRADTSG